MVTLKLILLFTIFLFHKCNSEARHYHNEPKEETVGGDRDELVNYFKYLQSLEDAKKAESADETIATDDTGPNLQSSANENDTFVPPPRSALLGTEVVKANIFPFMVRLFSKCGDTNVSEALGDGIIMAENTVVTTAHSIVGHHSFKVCIRKENETKCAADPDDEENCFAPNVAYIHQDFFSGLVHGVQCANLAVLKWNSSVFQPNQVHTMNYSYCSCDFLDEDKIVTMVECGKEVNTDLKFYLNEVQPREDGVSAYGNKYLQCPLLYTEKNDNQTTVPCAGSAGSALFLSKTPENSFYHPNEDSEESAVLYGLGSVVGKDCNIPSGFVSLCDYELFFSDPETYGVSAVDAFETLSKLEVADQIKVVKTLLVDRGHLSCALQFLLRRLLETLGPLFAEVFGESVFDEASLNLPNFEISQ